MKIDKGNCRTWVTTYIGLPGMQYRDVTTWADDAVEARSLADIELLMIYGTDGFDCLDTKEPEFHTN